MLIDDKKEALGRVWIGALLGAAAYLLLSWLLQPGSLFGGPSGFDFTFCFNGNVPEALGAAVGLLTWGAFGAEAAVATLPFADTGKAVVVRSLAHFAVMTATMWAWVLLNFADTHEPLPDLILTFQLPFTLLYALVWLGRWVGWYAEVAQIRERLGLAPGRSPLKWRETLPHIGFALLLCLVTPLVLRLCDAPDVPLLSGLLYPYLLLPMGGFISAVSLGKRQGFCPLYPVASAVFILLFIPLASLWFHTTSTVLLPVALLSTLLGNALGALLRQYQKGEESCQ